MNRNGRLDETKAGLNLIDRDTINSIIAQETHGTAKFLRMREKERSSCARSTVLAQRASVLTPQDIRQETSRVDQMISEATQNLRDWRSVMAVLDFDCFYASVEERDDSSLRGRPVIITGGSIVCASNYEARKYGVRSAMPTHVAKALCKDVVAIPASIEKYMAVSHAAAEIFARYDAHHSMHGLDECVFNLTAYIERYAYEKYGIVDIWSANIDVNEQCIDLTAPSPDVSDTNTLFKGEPGAIEMVAAEVVAIIRKDVASNLGITCSVGVAINQQVAKIFTDLNKPNGQTIGPLHSITQDNYSAVLHTHIKDLHIRKLWGIGDASAQMLGREPFMITSIGDIFLKRGLLSLLLTPTQSKFYILASVGLSSVHQLMNRNGPNPKSVGQECTFPETSDEEVLRNVLRNLCKLVAQRLQEQNLVPTRLNVKVRFADWIEKTHVVDLSRYSWDLDVLYLAALESLRYIQKCKIDEIGYPMPTCDNNDDESAGHKAVRYQTFPYLTVGFGVYRRLARCTDIRLLGVNAHTFLECKDNSSGSILYQLNKAETAHRRCIKNYTENHIEVHPIECIGSIGSADESDTEVVVISSSTSSNDNDSAYCSLSPSKGLKGDFRPASTMQRQRIAELSTLNRITVRHTTVEMKRTRKLKNTNEPKKRHNFIISSKPLHSKTHIGRSST